MNWKNSVLLVASLLFYSWGEPVWVFAMIGSTLFNYLCAFLIDRAKSRLLRILFLLAGVTVSIAALFYFKYAAFLFNSFGQFFGTGWSLPVRKLPVGISFYTFQILTYTVDVYRKKSPVQRSFFKLMLYISCFPQLIAGPIVQYSDVAQMLDSRTSTPDGFVAGLKHFVIGLAKKVLIANLCGAIIGKLPAISAEGSISTLCAWYMAVLYSLQLYFDFSGYSDMAIGLGRVFGFTYKQNFNYPYISKSVGEFWRRWHISLGSFFRDYVYIPLGGNRRGAVRTVVNLLTVWMLTGLWHGASWNFVLWGLYYGLLLILERFVLGRLLEKLPPVLRVFTTLFFVIVGWVLFYYTDLSQAIRHLGAMFGIGAAGIWDEITAAVIRKYSFLPLLSMLACVPILPAIRAKLKPGNAILRISEPASSLALTVILALSVLFMIGQSYNPFIYFRF